MKRTFKSECERKERLFSAWDKVLNESREAIDAMDSVEPVKFDQLFEGIATVSAVYKNCIGLHLESGEKIRYLKVGPRVCLYSSPLDNILVMLGKYQGKWWPLDIVSIGSPMSLENEFHVSGNSTLPGCS